MRAAGMLAGVLVVNWVLAACGGGGLSVPAAVVTVTATPTPTQATPSPITLPTPPSTPPPTAPATPTPPPPTAPSTPKPHVNLSRPPRTYAQAIAHIDAGRMTPGETARFTSPSGNIYCSLTVVGMPVGCELRVGRIDDPSACPGAMTTSVGRIELRSEKAVAVCNTDTIRQPGAPVLAYGDVANTRDTECVSEQIGVTCVSRASHYGFFLHQGGFAIF